jgi:hypothetical protein
LIIEEDKFLPDFTRGERTFKLHHFLNEEQAMGHQTMDLYEPESNGKSPLVRPKTLDK